MKSYFDHFSTPLGLMEVQASNEAVLSIHFVERTHAVARNAITTLAKQQLQAYFASQLQQFELPLAATGTAFQQQVWAALKTIEYGSTCSYAVIAKKINNPKAVRAVGAANGKNPLTIVVPCHRVIGSDGNLSGYASGTERKAWLLRHESSGTA
jgi:methylated-DNA-[protein]-cysteine S-methyltransferase